MGKTIIKPNQIDVEALSNDPTMQAGLGGGGGSGATELNDLSDVTLSGSPLLASGDVLTYIIAGSPNSGLWENRQPPLTRTDDRNIVVGESAGNYDGFNANFIDGIFIGDEAGFHNRFGAHTINIGKASGRSNVGGAPGANDGNIAIGAYTWTGAGGAGSGSSLKNTIIGHEAARYAGPGGGENTLLGWRAGYNLEGARFSNTLVGTYAGSNLTADSNVVLGNRAGPLPGSPATLAGQSGQLFIHNSVTDTPLIYGDFSSGELVINGNLTVTGTVYAGSPSVKLGAGGGSSNNWLIANNNVDFSTAPIASGSNSITIGDNASSGVFTNDVTIGTYATTDNNSNITIGHNTSTSGPRNVAVGYNSSCGSQESVAIGFNADTSASAYPSVAIGKNVTSSNNNCIVIGDGITTGGDRTIILGKDSTSLYSNQVIVGNDLTTSVTNSDNDWTVKIGYGPANANRNFLHLFNKGKLELYGDEAQFIMPSYLAEGSPTTYPSNPVTGGTIFDTSSNGLGVYTGTEWITLVDPLLSRVADGASAIGFDYDTTNAFTTNGARIANWSTSGVTKAGLECNQDTNDYFALRFDDVEAVANNFYIGYYQGPPANGSEYAGMFSDHGDFWLGVSSDTKTYVNYYNGTHIELGQGANEQTVNVYGSLVLNNGDIDNVKTVTFNNEINNTVTGGSPNTDIINWQNGQKQRITISFNTSLTFTAPIGVANLTLKLINGGTGNITWPGNVLWPSGIEPVWTTSGTDLISFYYDGTNYYGMAGLNFS